MGVSEIGQPGGKNWTVQAGLQGAETRRFSGNSLLQVKVFCKNHFIRLKNHNSLLYRDYGHLNTLFYFFLHVFCVFAVIFEK